MGWGESGIPTEAELGPLGRLGPECPQPSPWGPEKSARAKVVMAGAKVLMGGAKVLTARAKVIMARVAFARPGLHPKVKPSGHFLRF